MIKIRGNDGKDNYTCVCDMPSPYAYICRFTWFNSIDCTHIEPATNKKKDLKSSTQSPLMFSFFLFNSVPRPISKWNLPGVTTPVATWVLRALLISNGSWASPDVPSLGAFGAQEELKLLVFDYEFFSVQETHEIWGILFVEQCNTSETMWN